MIEFGIAYFVFALLVGLGVGTFSGLFGVGGGVLMVPAFIYIPQFALKGDTHRAMATSLAAMVPIAIAGVARYASQEGSGFQYKAPLVICVASLIVGTLLAKYFPAAGKVSFELATAISVGSILGSFFIGVPVAKLIPSKTLAELFGLLIVVLGIRMTGVIPWLWQHISSRN